MLVGEFAVHLDCRRRVPPAAGQLLILEVLGRRLSVEVVSVARYSQPAPVAGGAVATHFVRLRARSVYLEE